VKIAATADLLKEGRTKQTHSNLQKQTHSAASNSHLKTGEAAEQTHSKRRNKPTGVL
jgi:hypothetical protein